MQKAISIILIFALLYSLNGCYTSYEYEGATKDVKIKSNYKKAKFKSGGYVEFLYSGAKYNDSTNSVYGLIENYDKNDKGKFSRIDSFEDYSLYPQYEDLLYVEIDVDTLSNLSNDEYIFVKNIVLQKGQKISFADPGGMFLIKEGREVIIGNIDLRDFYQVSILLDSNEFIGFTPPALVEIPVERVEYVEFIYEKFSAGKTILAIFGTLGILAGIGIILISIFKQSCPFIYSYDGTDFIFEGEIYSGTILPSLERDDYLTLPSIKAVNNEYKIKMTNEVKEEQYTNLTELIVVDHQYDTKVIIDKYGTVQTLNDIKTPISAKDTKNNSVLAKIISKDDLNYTGNQYEFINDEKEKLELTFKKPQNTDKAKLIINAKNAYWLDYMFEQFYSLLGDSYDDWYKDQEKKSNEEMINWSLNQGIPLSVYVERDGEWVFEDYFNVIGPMAYKEDVLSIDVSDIEGEFLNIKLEFGFLFWDIDKVGIDFSDKSQLQISNLQLNTAIDQNGNDVSALLLKKDSLYHPLVKLDEYVELSFTAPELPTGYERTVVLHSSGHYKTLLKTEGAAELMKLFSLKGSGKFIEFSKEKYQEIIEAQ